MKKTSLRDIGLVAMGFFGGALVTLMLALSSGPVPRRSASTVLVTGNVWAAMSPPIRFVVATNLGGTLPAMRFEMNDRFDPGRPFYSPSVPSVDLIDSRYQPDIKPEDLK